jgi:lipoate-protein ligase A
LHAGAYELVADPGTGRLVRTVRIADVVAPAIVVGSGQPVSDVDRDRAVQTGVDVVRRRSGGGAVLVGADHVAWVDVVLPIEDPLWDPDVGRASWWLGERWAEALRRIGWLDAVVWRGRLQRTAWSSRVCFAGLGPGEVSVVPPSEEGTVGEGLRRSGAERGSRRAKVVGISQRRTRHGALFQCAALLRWDPDLLVELLSLSDEERPAARRELAVVARGIGPEASGPLLAEFLNQLQAGLEAPI